MFIHPTHDDEGCPDDVRNDGRGKENVCDRSSVNMREIYGIVVPAGEQTAIVVGGVDQGRYHADDEAVDPDPARHARNRSADDSEQSEKEQVDKIRGSGRQRGDAPTCPVYQSPHESVIAMYEGQKAKLCDGSTLEPCSERVAPFVSDRADDLVDRQGKQPQCVTLLHIVSCPNAEDI